jgi:hypothetical protein
MGIICLVLFIVILFAVIDGSLPDRVMAICIIAIIFIGALKYFSHVSESAKTQGATEAAQVGTASLPEDNRQPSESPEKPM